MSATLEPIATLSRDLRKAASTLGEREARGLTDLYYQFQKERIGLTAQVRAAIEVEEPHSTVLHFSDQFFKLESQIKSALDAYSLSSDLGQWSRSIVGIGPVIAAGLLAHIDVSQSATAGAIWRFAGLDPSVTWNKGEKRPWNARLKVICWHMGGSFVKFRSKDNCFYGHLYELDKNRRVAKNEAGGFADLAKATLEKRNIQDAATKKTYLEGKLPVGRIDLQARRYAVKIFLSHYHKVGREILGLPVPNPFAIEHLGHAHVLEVPNWPM